MYKMKLSCSLCQKNYDYLESLNVPMRYPTENHWNSAYYDITFAFILETLVNVKKSSVSTVYRKNLHSTHRNLLTSFIFSFRKDFVHALQEASLPFAWSNFVIDDFHISLYVVPNWEPEETRRDNFDSDNYLLNRILETTDLDTKCIIL